MMIGKKLSLRISFILSVLCLFGLLGPVQAQFSGDIDINFKANQTGTITVGDPVELTLSVKHPAGYEILVPPLPQVWGEYEVRNQGQTVTVENGDGTETTTQVVEVALFAPGTSQSPSFGITVRDNDGQVFERVVPQVSLTVTPILTEADPQLHDIKPQIDLPINIPWLLIIAGTVITIILVLLFWWIYRRFLAPLLGQTAFGDARPYIDPRPPYQIAYDELDRINQLDLPGQGRFKEYYSLVTDCLRNYLGGMYDVPAIDLTTAETKQALARTNIRSEHSRRFIDLFTEGDLVKFARFVPDIESARLAIPQARDLVDITKIIRLEPDESDETMADSTEPEKVA
jgi:hypothetical protein